MKMRGEREERTEKTYTQHSASIYALTAISRSPQNIPVITSFLQSNQPKNKRFFFF